MSEYIKPRAYGEPISMDAPGFNPLVHKDLVLEVNDVLTEFADKQLEVVDSESKLENNSAAVVNNASGVKFVYRSPSGSYHKIDLVSYTP